MTAAARMGVVRPVAVAMGDGGRASFAPPWRAPGGRGVANAAAAVVGLVALVGGCASSSSSASSTAQVSATVSTTMSAPVTSAIGAPTPTAVAPTAVAPVTSPASTLPTAPAAAPAAAATTPPIDPAATLQQAVAALGASYHFATTATVNGAVALRADGDRIGDGSRLAVTANGATVQYVITADGTWVQQPGQDWQQLDDPPATADPVSALSSPSAVAVSQSDGTTVGLTVTVPSVALGIPGDGDVPVSAVVVGGVLTTVGYDTTVSGVPASVTATLGAPADTSPVSAPA